LRAGVPITEYDTINYGLAVERTHVETFDTSPQQYKQFVADFGNTNTALIATAGWSRDGRDSAIYTTSGLMQRVNLELAVPPADLQYYRTTYRVDWWHPIGRGERPSALRSARLTPTATATSRCRSTRITIWRIGSVRGYETSAIGPKDELGNALGGRTLTVANVEYYFPMPGLEKDKSCGSRCLLTRAR
jgi:outer membrane protein insertion porin family